MNCFNCVILNRNDEFRLVCKMLYGLAYIPEEDVFEVWELVVGFCRSDPQRSVAKYFGDTYVNIFSICLLGNLT